MTFAAIFKDLMTHLNLEVGHIKDQKGVLIRERASLISRDMEGILDCINEKEALKTQAVVLDESRKILIARLSGFLDTPEDKVTLSRVAERVDEPLRASVLKVKWHIENLLSQVEDLSNGNRYLIRSALGHASRSLGFLSQFQGGLTSTYDEEGRVTNEGLEHPRVEQQV